VFLAACGGGGGGSKTPTQPLGITSTVLPQATVNVPYTFIVQASGGSGTYTWAITSGTLPPGLTFDGTTAVLGGTPTTPGVFKFTVQVTDSKNDTASQLTTLTVGGAIDVTCNSCFANTLMLPAGTPGTPYSASFSATGGIAPYTWCIVEPNNGTCDNGSGGALPAGLTMNSTTGVISGTPTTAQAPAQFTVQATDSETPPSVGTALITLSIFGVTTASLPSGEIYIPYGTQQMTVAGGTSPYSWCVKEANGSCDNGSGGALPPGITLSASCISTRQTTCAVSGTPTAAGTYPFTVQVTDSETPPAVTTSAFSISIAGISNGALNGNYIFDFTGYNNGKPVLMIGAFTADGQGNITAGEIDLNNGTGEPIGDCQGFKGPQQQTIMPAPSSTYSIGASGTGTGTLTLVTSAGAYNFTIAIRLDGSGNLIQDNTDPATRGSGSIRVQTPNVGVDKLEANFALGMHGADPSGNRYVAAGQIVVEDNQGDFNGPALDVDDGGTPTQHTFGGTLSGNIDSFGRGCFANMSFDKQNSIYTYTYYVVDENYLEILSTDPVGGTNNANLTLWSLQRQIVGVTGFNNANLTTPNVVELQAQDTSGSSDVTTGLFVGQGNSSHTCQSGQFDTATFTYDENQAGSGPNQKPQSITGQYCVDKSTGRVTLQNFTGVWANAPVFYLGGNDPGFVVGTDAGNTSGSIEAQTGADFGNAAVGGGYWGGTISPAIAAATDSVTSLNADGNGNIKGTQYISAPGGPGGPTNLTYTYSLDSSGSGRGVVQNNGQTVGVLYVVAPTGSNQFQSKFVLLPTGNNPVLNVFLGTAR